MLTDEEVKGNVGENVRRLLDARGWSQADLALAAGETQMMISRICRSQHMPFAGTLARIAEALDVSVDRLVGPAPEAPAKKSSSDRLTRH